jgi:hypothetical protein
MSDLNARQYLEKYFPTSHLADQFRETLNVHVVGSAKPMQLIANGEVKDFKNGNFEIRFPSHFTPSCHFVHLIDPTKFHFVTGTIQGREGPIPYTFYGLDPTLVDQALPIVERTIAEMEKLIGPYPHRDFIAHIVPGDGGMEQAGLADGSIIALDHEVVHTFVGRGAMPASGRDGWIDEGFASWHDYGSEPAKSLRHDERYPKLTGSPHQQGNSDVVYDFGRAVFEELDLLFAEVGGLMPIIGEFFRHYMLRTYTTEDLERFLIARAPPNLPISIQDFFTQRVHGGERDVIAAVV